MNTSNHLAVADSGGVQGQWFRACIAASKAVRPSTCGHEWSAGFVSGALWRPISRPKPSEDAACQHGKDFLVEGCLRCGAPICCGRCCVEDELRQVHPGEVAYQLTKLLTVDISTARAAVDAAIAKAGQQGSEA